MKKRTLYSLWFICSTLIFIWVLFPSEFAEEILETRTNQALRQAQVDLNGLGLSVPPGLNLDALSLSVSQMPELKVTDIRVSPSWHTLVTSSPGGSFTADLFGGELSVRLRSGYKPPLVRALDVTMAALDLSKLSPLLKGALPVPVSLSGLGEGVVHLADDKGLLKGEGSVSLRGVSVGLNELPIPLGDIVFNAVDGEVEINGFQVKVKRLKAKGPQISADFRGTITLSRRMDASRLNLTGSVSPDAGFVKTLSDKIPLSMLVDPKRLKQKRIGLRIEGTLGNPRVSLN